MTGNSVQRVVPTRTLGLETLTDVQAFRHALGKRMSLPRLRIALRLGELPEDRAQKYERRINGLLCTHGLVELAAGAGLSLILMIMFPLQFSALSTGMNVLLWITQMLVGTLAGGAFGRHLAIRNAWKKLRALFRRLEHELRRIHKSAKKAAGQQLESGAGSATEAS